MKKSIEVQVRSGQKVVLTGSIAAIGGDDRVRIVRTRKQGKAVELLRDGQSATLDPVRIEKLGKVALLKDGQSVTLGGLVIKASVPQEGPATLQVADNRRVRRK